MLPATLRAPSDDGGGAGDPAGPVRWIALALLTGTCFVIPCWELAVGTWPPPLDDEALSWRELHSGGTTRALEEALRKRSIAAFQVRPRYNELVFELLERTVPEVVLGDDGWLFYAPAVLGYPPAGWRERLREDVHLLESLAGWFEERGTHLVLIVPPNKESFLPGLLRGVRRGFEPVYDEILAELSAAGLLAPDLLAAMSRQSEPAYYVTDTHWTYPGALASMEAVSAALRARFGAALPGEPVDGVLVEQPAELYRGDLHAMLGLVPGGRADRRLMIDVRYHAGIDRETGELIEGAPDGALILTGTSFSDPPYLASILSAVLGRRVSDRTILGLGHSAGVLEVAYAVHEGRQPAPAVLFWEVAERLLLLERDKTFEALRTFLATVAFEHAEAEPLSTARAAGLRGRLERRTAAGLEVVSEGSEPQLVLELPPGVRGDGSAAIRYRVASDRAGLTRLWVEAGGGRETSRPVQRDLVLAGRACTATMPLLGEGEVCRVRIGADCERSFTIESLELLRR
jgi:hypothetical protein